MIPTPAPGNMPVVCHATFAAFKAQMIAGYAGPNRSSVLYHVVTDGSWAYVAFGIGEEGGQSVLRRVGDRWCRVAGGGGVLSEAELIDVTGPEHGKRLWHRMGNR